MEEASRLERLFIFVDEHRVRYNVRKRRQPSSREYWHGVSLQLFHVLSNPVSRTNSAHSALTAYLCDIRRDHVICSLDIFAEKVHVDSKLFMDDALGTNTNHFASGGCHNRRKTRPRFTHYGFTIAIKCSLPPLKSRSSCVPTHLWKRVQERQLRHPELTTLRSREQTALSCMRGKCVLSS